MQNKSSDSVKVTWLDREAVLAKIKEGVERLANRHPEIRQVILFGSLARGDAVPGSDADLLFILDRSNLSFIDRIPRYTPSGCDIGAEAFPYTIEEFEQMKKENNPLIKRVLGEGIKLFKR